MRTSGPSDEEIRAAAEIAGGHRVSVPGADPDRPPAGAEQGRVADRDDPGFWPVLYERRTTRRFDPERPVPREIVLELLDAALIAPTSCNLQMWDFIVVDDPDQREALGRLSLQVLSTPVSIFVTYGTEYSEEGHANVQSAAAALQNMSLAAHALGMGTFWINQLGPRPEVGRILGVPPDREVIAALAIGWPKVYPTKAPRRRPFEHVVHWNHYGGSAIPTSPSPADWSLVQIRDYQNARVLNGNRYNKSRPWEMTAALQLAERLAPRDDSTKPDPSAPAWLDVLPVHGLFTGAMSRHHKDHRWFVLELTESVARFGLKRCMPPQQGGVLVYAPESLAGDPPDGLDEAPRVPADAARAERFDVITVLHRLESLPPDERVPLLVALRDLLTPKGRIAIQVVSRRSFHALASWMHARRGGPGGVEYVLSPDPNLGPYEALLPADVERWIDEAGLVVVESYADDVVPSEEEVTFRTRNMSGAKRRVITALIGVARFVLSLPGLRTALARDRTWVVARRS